MDWIETVLNAFGIVWSPDAGNGTFEVAINTMVVWVPATVAAVVLFVTIQRHKITGWVKSRRTAKIKKG